MLGESIQDDVITVGNGTPIESMMSNVWFNQTSSDCFCIYLEHLLY